jgi:hypothetical protein
MKLSSVMIPLRLNLVFLLGAMALFAAQVGLNAQVRVYDPPFVPMAQSRGSGRDPRVFRMLSAGHLSAWVDWIWIRALAEGAQGVPGSGGPSPLVLDLNLIADLDPPFFQVYEGGGDYLAVIRHEAGSARALVQKGIDFARAEFDSLPTPVPRYGAEFRERFWRRRWNLSLILAYIDLFLLDNLADASRAFQDAGQLPHAPPHLIRLAQRLRVPGGEYEVGLKLLDFKLLQARDTHQSSEEIEALQRKKFYLSVGEFLFRVNRDYREFLQASQRVAAPQEWARFMKASQRPQRDPWGGMLSVAASGEVVTTTPHEAVFHLK